MRLFVLAMLMMCGSAIGKEIALIKDGKILDGSFIAKNWTESGGKLMGTDKSTPLQSVKSIGEGDFSIKTVLSIKELKGSASGFMLGGNLLGFDSRSGDFFLEGKEFAQKSLPKTATLIESNKEFALVVTRKKKLLKFTINGEKLTEFKFHDKKVSGFGLRPHRNNMTVTSLTFDGILINPPKLKYVFACGDDGYKSYRIPSLIKTNKGTLLAFAEGRVHSWHDSGDIDLVMKRSTDDGNTWSKLQVVRDIKQTAGNPCPIVDQKTGRIVMVFCEMDHHEYHVMEGKSDRRVFVTYSEDDGKTWSEPKNITKQVNPGKKYNWLASGPGVGIQLKRGKHKGRLVVPMANSIKNKYGVHTIYSDDCGKSWKVSDLIEGGCNESQLVELNDGRLMLNMRMQQNSRGYRGVAFSKDDGATWSKFEHDDELNDPTCQASIIRYKDLLVFSNPATGGRNGMTLRTSKDFGKSWSKGLLVYPHSSGYSCLAVTKDKKVACLFEGGVGGYAQHGIAIVRKSLSELLKTTQD